MIHHVLNMFVNIQTSKEFIHMDTNKMMTSGIFVINWSGILDDVLVIRVGSVKCNLNALISMNDNNILQLAVKGPALKSPIRIVFLTFPKYILLYVDDIYQN